MNTLAIAQDNPLVGDIEGNAKKALQAIEEARKEKVDLLVFPELFLIGYFPYDLLLEEDVLSRIESALLLIQRASSGMHVIMGAPLGPKDAMGRLFNGAVHFFDGHRMGSYKKRCLPFYDVFYEPRYFREGNDEYVFDVNGQRVALSICEDLFSLVPPWDSLYAHHPLESLKGSIDLLVNISASPWHYGKSVLREDVVKKATQRLEAPILYVNQVGANDELLFDGGSCFVKKDGVVSFRAPFWKEGLFLVGEGEEKSIHEDRIEAILTGIRDYFRKSFKTKAVVGMSGGIDSSVVTSLLTLALGKENVTAFFLPSRFTAKENREDFHKVVTLLGISHKTHSIEPIFESILQSLNLSFHGEHGNLPCENIQARIRSLLLMAEANQSGALLVCTSNKSELSMGYSTLYGDMTGAIAPIGDLFKQEVYDIGKELIKRGISLPGRLFTKTPSAELCWNQTDQDTLPSYEVLEPLLTQSLIQHAPIELSVREILFHEEFKRKQSPLVLRLSEKSFGRGRLFPLAQKFT